MPKQVVVAKAISAGDTSTTAQLAGAAAQTLGTAAAFQAAGLTSAQADAISHAKPVPLVGLQTLQARITSTRRRPWSPSSWSS